MRRTANKSAVRVARRKPDARLSCVSLNPRGNPRGRSPKGTAARACGLRLCVNPRGKKEEEVPGDAKIRRGKEEVPGDGRRRKTGRKRNTPEATAHGGGGGDRGPRGTLLPSSRAHPADTPLTRPRHTRDTPGTRRRHTQPTPPAHPGDTPATHPADTPGTHPPSRTPHTPNPAPVRDGAERGLSGLMLCHCVPLCALPVHVVPRYLGGGTDLRDFCGTSARRRNCGVLCPACHGTCSRDRAEGRDLRALRAGDGGFAGDGVLLRADEEHKTHAHAARFRGRPMGTAAVLY